MLLSDPRTAIISLERHHGYPVVPGGSEVGLHPGFQLGAYARGCKPRSLYKVPTATYCAINKEGSFFNEVWLLDLPSRSWCQPELQGEGPSPRCWVSGVFCGRRGSSSSSSSPARMLVYGGGVWSFDPEECWGNDTPGTLWALEEASRGFSWEFPLHTALHWPCVRRFRTSAANRGGQKDEPGGRAGSANTPAWLAIFDGAVPNRFAKADLQLNKLWRSLLD